MTDDMGLFERVCSFPGLIGAAHSAMKGKRGKIQVARFWRDLEGEVLQLERELLDGSYRPRPYRVFVVTDPKQRAICAADFRDRVVHHAVCAVLEPLFERSCIFDSYACRKNRGAHAAIARVQQFSRRYRYFAKLDVHKFFDSVDHAVLRGLVRRKVSDVRLLALVDSILSQPVPWTPAGKGLPIGNLTSQHFANLYLDPVDHLVKDTLGLGGYARYMDDLFLLADDKALLWAAVARVERMLNCSLLLSVRDGSVLVAPVQEGIPCLGFRVFPGTIRIDRRGWCRFCHKLAALEQMYLVGLVTPDELSIRATSLLAHVASGDTRRLRQAYFSGRKPLEA